MRSRRRIITLIVLIVGIIACAGLMMTCSATSVSSDESSITMSSVNGYSFDSYAKRLKTARSRYEVATVPNSSKQKALTPLSDIPKARYKKNKETGIYENASAENDGVADIMLAGDLMCRQGQQQAAKKKYGKYDFQDMFPYMKPVLTDCDFVAGNLETTLAESAKYTYSLNRTKDGKLNRNAPSTMLDAVRDAGFDMVVTANNHCLDASMKGLYQTICHLKQYKLMYTGTFLDKKDRNANPYVIADIDGIKVGFLSYTYGTNGRAKLIKSAGRKYFINLYSSKKAKADIAAAKAAGAEFVIVYMHWGVEYSHEISEKQLAQAKELADFGVDFIAGSHPHVTQPFDYVTGSEGKTIPVIYSMGDFISSMDKKVGRDSAVINLKLAKKKDSIEIKEISYIPCYTCVEYEDFDYTTVPLTDEMCKENKELTESRERISNVLGPKIKESSIVHSSKTE